MSKLEELIAELCPDGVVYKALGEIAVNIYRGSGIKRDQITPTGTPCVRYGEIYTTYGIWFNECVSFTNEATITNKKHFELGDILFAITGESIEEIAKSCAYIGHEKCLAGGDIVVLKHNQDPKYLSYALSTTDAQKQKSKGKVKSKVVHSSVPAISNIRIPLPPLLVQRKIVRILDNLTELTAKLTTNLTAELTARKKQYEYYRKYLLTFGDDVEWKTLGEVCDLSAGGDVLKEHYSKEKTGEYTVPIYSNGIEDNALYGYTDNAKIYSPSVTISARGTIGYSALRKEPYYPIIRLICAVPQKILYAEYLQYAVQTIRFRVPTTGIPQLTVPMVSKYKIPVPTLTEQARIVAILDRFDTLCNDLTSGLPAEIEARRKQYEYYRDTLLTFKEATA